MIILASGAMLYALIAWVCVALVALVPRRRNPRTHPDLYPNGATDRTIEPVSLTCQDGLRIDAAFLPASGGANGSAANLIMLHGISDCKERLLPGAAEMADLGYNVLLLDFRGHGLSEGRLCTYGFYERLDVRAAADWLEARHAGPIAIYGLSLGGAVALLAADADPRIAAVVSEGAYARLRRIIGDYAAHRGALRIIQRPALYWIGKIGRFRIDACDPIKAAGRLSIPVLLIHGRSDRHVRPDYARQLAEQMNGRCELWLVDRAVHSRCREVAGRQYSTRIAAFLDRWLRSGADRPQPGSPARRAPTASVPAAE